MEPTVLREYQKEAMAYLSRFDKSAAYMEMGLGKTFIGSEMIKKWLASGTRWVLVLCQKSKLADWLEHLRTYLPSTVPVINGRKDFKAQVWDGVMVMNYEYIVTGKRSPFFKKLLQEKGFDGAEWGLVCDESSVLQSISSQRSEMVIGTAKNRWRGLGTRFHKLLLLSGTPCNGKYERLFVQAKALGYKGNRMSWYDRVCVYFLDETRGYSYNILSYTDGDKVNTMMRNLGGYFLKADDVLDLPEEQTMVLRSKPPAYYNKFRKDRVCVDDNGKEWVGDQLLKKFTYERQLIALSKNKMDLLRELLESTDERVVIGTSFREEYLAVISMCEALDRPVCAVTGMHKDDLSAYRDNSNGIVVIQYQAGSKGINLQEGSIIIMSSPPVSAEDYMQTRGRIKREGQKNKCRYYELIGGEIEYKVYDAVRTGVDYTMAMYESDINA